MKRGESKRVSGIVEMTAAKVTRQRKAAHILYTNTKQQETTEALTSAVGLDVGDTEGSMLDEGEADGPFEGDAEGCEMRMMRTK